MWSGLTHVKSNHKPYRAHAVCWVDGPQSEQMLNGSVVRASCPWWVSTVHRSRMVPSGGKGNQNNSVTSHIREHHLCVYLCALLPSVKTGGVESCSTSWQISSSQSRNALGPRWQGRGTSKSLADVAAAQNRRQGSQQSWEILDITWIHFVKFKVLESAWKQMRSLKMLEKSPNFNLLIVVFWLSCANMIHLWMGRMSCIKCMGHIGILARHLSVDLRTSYHHVAGCLKTYQHNKKCRVFFVTDS